MSQPDFPERIALFGGSFDPVHCGHLEIARSAVLAAGLDRVIFLPALQSPHKIGRAASAGAEQRLEMLRLATRGLDWAEVSDWEMRQLPPSWSWRTVQHYRNIYPSAKLFWILGADQWDVMETWAKPEILRDNLTFLVFPRPPAGEPKSRKGWNAQVVEVRLPVSSTAIREELAEGAKEVADMPYGVLKYIQRENLYTKTADDL